MPAELRAGELVNVNTNDRQYPSAVVLQTATPADIEPIAAALQNELRTKLEQLEVDQVAVISYRHGDHSRLFCAIHQRGFAHWRDLQGNLLTIEETACAAPPD